ncbi:MAG: hypothetical protein PF541_00230 [Prolixibacteraceae bacterium]|nr:hypothetical protein [Prolixibacteraceae bacterium]
MIKFQNVVEASDPVFVYYKAFDAGTGIFVEYQMASGVFIQLNTHLLFVCNE